MAKNETAEVEQTASASGSGVSVYIGPSIKGIIQTATIFEGSPEDVIKSAEGSIAYKQRPGIKDLIIDAADLPDAQAKVKTPGEPLYKAYRDVLRNK